MESNYRNSNIIVPFIHIFYIEYIVGVEIPFQLPVFFPIFIVVILHDPRAIDITTNVQMDVCRYSTQVVLMYQYPLCPAARFPEEPNTKLVLVSYRAMDATP